MADDEEGWSIHVPTTGFTTTQVEGEEAAEPLPPALHHLRVVEPDAAAAPDDAAG